MTVERAKQRYSPSQPIDPQALPIGDIEAVLSAVKALKISEVERFQATELARRKLPLRERREAPAVESPDLSFLMFSDADSVPIMQVQRLVVEYERLCPAEVDES